MSRKKAETPTASPAADAPKAETTGADMTNVRHPDTLEGVVDALNKLAESDTDADRAFAIGDLVELATKKHKVRVADLVKQVRLSRQRMCECRVTAVAFKGQSRKQDVPFHFYTIAARAARTFQMSPVEALKKVTAEKLETTRQASRYFAELRRASENREALGKSALLLAKQDELIDRCHHEDFRTVLARFDPGSVKLVIADPPYDGERTSTTSATTRLIDANTEAETQAAITDLLTVMADKMAKGGALILCRPGAAMDPTWLSDTIERSGWSCAWALTWNKHKAKPGRMDAPYGITSERILVLCRTGDTLTAHDDSARDEVLDFRPMQPHNKDVVLHHQHEKPVDLMKHLVGKHTYEGELVVEPFGGTGPACQAAEQMSRHWVYCETVAENIAAATERIGALKGQQRSAG